MSIVDQVFALLFVADAPATSAQLANALGVGVGQVDEALDVLATRLDQAGPLHLVRLAGGAQLATKPEHAELISRFLLPAKQRLSRSLMEVLAIVAYKQPITIAEVESIRGAQSDYGVRALLERRLIEEKGRKPVPGRPILYGTTDQFLHQFKMNDLAELPPFTPDSPQSLPTLPLEDSSEAELPVD